MNGKTKARGSYYANDISSLQDDTMQELLISNSSDQVLMFH
jgi:hypothetical protein